MCRDLSDRLHHGGSAFMKLGLLILVFASGPLRAEEDGGDFQRYAAMFQQKCAKCHTVGLGDRVGPDLKGVSKRRERKWILDFIRKPGDFLDSDKTAMELLKKFNKVRMDELNLNEADAAGLLDYIDAASEGPVGPQDLELPEPDPYARLSMPDEHRGILIGFAATAAGLLALAAVLFQFGFVRIAAIAAILSLASGYWANGGRRDHRVFSRQQGYAPEQPLAFSHAKHAGTLQIACLYCHYAAERSDAAGVPPLKVCMNCHKDVKRPKEDPNGVGEREIKKIVDAWERRADPAEKGIQWVRVHDLPDYAFFSHRVHVGNNVKCQECHGPVQTMERMRQAAPLTMGWCVECHRRPPSEAPGHWKRAGATLDCAVCHR